MSVHQEILACQKFIENEIISLDARKSYIVHQNMSSDNSNNLSKTVSDSTNGITSGDIVFATLYSFIVFFGVLGNGIVIIIVRKTPAMHTTTNYLLMNLAVADLLSVLFCPGFYDFALRNVKLQKTIGDFVCKVFAITVLESIFTLVVVAVERYLALVKPFQTNARLRKDNVGVVITATWIIASLVCLPGILSNNYVEDATKYPCNRPWTLDNLDGLKKTYIIVFCFVFIITPAAVILFCYLSISYGVYFKRDIYHESPGNMAEDDCKKRLLKLLVSLAVAFVICCLPFALFFLYICFISKNTLIRDYDTLHLVHRSVRFLLIKNSFINPLLYAAQSSNYRRGLRKICSFCGENANEAISSMEMNSQQGC